MAFGPYDAARHAIGRARALLDASRSQVLAVNVRADMRRLSIVLAVAALDTYMHRLIVDRAFTHPELPRPLARIDVPFELLLAEADVRAEAARSDPHQSRPRVAVKRILRDRLLRRTFQTYEDVGKALAMAGRRRSWDTIGQRLEPPLAPDDIHARLDAIIHRRNQIVHEGDYRGLERPRNSGRNPLRSVEAQSAVDFLADLIDAIHAD
jgi:hypothetical protein